MSHGMAGAIFFGVLIGMALMARYATARERFRRVRRDIRAAKKGLKTLRTMFRRYLGVLLRTAAATLLIGGVLIVLVTR